MWPWSTAAIRHPLWWRARPGSTSEPYWGWYWYYDMPVDVADGGVPEKMVAPPWMPTYYPADNTFVAGGLLALRCYDDDFDLTFGGEGPRRRGLGAG